MTFNLGSLRDSENRIRRDFVEFSKLWLAVREDWLDQRCERFEKEHLSTLGPSMNRFSAALHQFCEAANKADRALKDDSRPSGELE